MNIPDYPVSPTPDEAFERALRLVGVRALAAACRVTCQAVYKWRRSGVPVSRAAGIETSTAGAVRAEHVCPGVTFTRAADGRVISYTLRVSPLDQAA